MTTAISTKSKQSTLTLQRWGGIAAFVLAASMLAANTIYLIGDLREAFGPISYDLADLLYGPVWGVSLVAFVFALRERIGELAPRRMTFSLLLAVLAAVAMLSVALIRSANRHYHLSHPELGIQDMSSVMIVWTALVAGLTGVGWHLFGWSFALAGFAGLTSQRLPQALSTLYVLVGGAALFVYLWPELEGLVILSTLVASIWQGVLFLQPPKRAKR